MLTTTLAQTAAPMPFNPAPAVLEDVQRFAGESRAATIAKHLPLVRHVAGTIARRSGSTGVVDYDDLVGYGSEGLIAAVESFNPAFGTKFSTWAVMHIRTTIQDALRTLDPLPRSLRTKSKEIERTSYELANRTGCWPTDTEIAAELSVPLAKLRQTQQEISKVCVSLDAVEDAHGEHSGYSWASAVADHDPQGDPEAALDSAETSLMLAKAIAALPERERTIIVAYYRQQRATREIAADLGVSESRVSQLHARALKLLRASITGALSDAPVARVA